MSEQKICVIFAVPSVTSEYLGVGVLAACLAQKGIDDVAVSSYALKDLKRRIRRESRTVLAFSMFAPFAKEARAAAEAVRREFPSVVIVAGGPYATFVPEMIHEKCFDGICRGEGESSFPAFVEYFRRQGTVPLDLPGWWVKDSDGRIYQNPPDSLWRNLDEIPFADRSLFPDAWFVRKGVRRFMFSRGCPCRCTYCTVAGFPQGQGVSAKEYYRVRSPSSAVFEIRTVKEKYGLRVVSIVDAIFGTDPKWLEEFAELYARDIRLPFYCNSEVRFVDEDYAARLKRAGCRLVMLGLETADDRIRQDVLGKNFTCAEFLSAARLLKRHGIKVGVYNMIGIPGGNLEQDFETVRVNQMVQADFPIAKVFSLFPGTSMYEQCCVPNPSLRGSIQTVRNVYWPVMSNKNIRPDLECLLRLHCLFSFCVGLRIPIAAVRFLTHLPLWPFYRVLAKISFLVQYGVGY